MKQTKNMRVRFVERYGEPDELRVYVGRLLEFIAYQVEGRYVIKVCKGGYAGYWLTAEPETDEGVIAACKEFYNEHSYDKVA